ncbi:MAG: tetratricopeptide repeat protein [Phycisphaerae bacterium]
MRNRTSRWSWAVPGVAAVVGLSLLAGAVGRACAEDKPADGAGAAPAAVKPAGPDGAKELAARFISLAQDTMRQKPLVPPHVRQAAALIKIAVGLDPQEPRYAKMLYEAMLQMGDSDAALAALTKYRAISQQTAEDQVAMVAFIDLNVRKLETAAERAEWLTNLLTVTAPNKDKGYAGLAAPVRAHLAFRASQVARERGQSDLEGSLLGQALELNPLNLDALRRRLEVATAEGTAADRVGLMVEMLKSNPVQPAVLYQVGRECSAAGANEEALRYYKLAANVAGASGVSLGREFAIGYATELALMDVPQVLNEVRLVADALTKGDPNDLEGHLLRWLAARASKDKEALVKAQGPLLNAALNRLAVLRNQLGVKEATTRPVDTSEAVAVPDLSGDLKLLEDEKQAGLRLPYAQAVADLAWYLVLAGNKPVEAGSLVPALKALLTDAHPLVVRLEGWVALVQDQKDAAKVKLSAAAEQDEFAQLGLVILRSTDPAEKDRVLADAKGLLTRNRSGLMAVVLREYLRGLNLKADPREDMADVRTKAMGLTPEFLRLLEAPASFYALRAEMVDRRVVFPYGEPMLASVSIRNVSKYPLTIGAEGVIKPDLWCDAQFRGLVQQSVPGAAYDKLGQVLVLAPGQSMMQVFRFDQGQSGPFGQVIANPGPTLTFYGFARTNPRGDGGSGLCGQGVQFTSISERSGFGLNQQGVQVLTGLLNNGTIPERLRSLDLVVALVSQLRAAQQQGQPNQQNMQQIANAFVDLLEQKAADPTPGVATWATFLTAVNAPTKGVEMMGKLLADPAPERRILGVLIAGGLPPAEHQALMKKVIAEDRSEAVKEYASASLEIAEAIAKGRAEQPKPAPAPGTGAAPAPAPAPKP